VAAVVNAARKAARRPLVEVGVAPDETDELPPSLPELAPLISSLPERQRLIVFLRFRRRLSTPGRSTARPVARSHRKASIHSRVRSIRGRPPQICLSASASG
jgi:hypothetical protein